MNCRKSTLTQLGYLGGRLFLRKVALKCKSWRCPDCSLQKARRIRARLENAFTGSKIRMLTLTAPTGLTLAEMVHGLSDWWHVLVNHLRRKFGLTKYAWVFELGDKKGRPHIHALIDCYVPQRALSRLAKQAGFGAVVDIRLLPTKKAFGYCVNYLSKGHASIALGCLQRSLHFRRFSCSRNIPPIDGKSGEWLTMPTNDTITTESEYIGQLLEHARLANLRVKRFDVRRSSATLELNHAMLPCQWEKLKSAAKPSIPPQAPPEGGVFGRFAPTPAAAAAAATAFTMHGLKFPNAQRILPYTRTNVARFPLGFNHSATRVLLPCVIEF